MSGSSAGSTELGSALHLSQVLHWTQTRSSSGVTGTACSSTLLLHPAEALAAATLFVLLVPVEGFSDSWRFSSSSSNSSSSPPSHFLTAVSSELKICSFSCFFRRATFGGILDCDCLLLVQLIFFEMRLQLRNDEHLWLMNLWISDFASR